MPSTEDESNVTIAIFLVSDFSALGSTVEEALLEAGCYIQCELHTLSVQSFMYHQYIFSFPRHGYSHGEGREIHPGLFCFL